MFFVITLKETITQPMNSENTHHTLSSRNRRVKLSKGFTLVEVLIVMALIGLLVGIATPNLFRIFENQKKNAADTYISTTLKTLITTYNLDVGKYPTSLDNLITNPGAGKRWQGPYLDKKVLDPWQNEYQYRYPGQRRQGGYDVWSNGPDGQSGTADDIGNWDS